MDKNSKKQRKSGIHGKSVAKVPKYCICFTKLVINHETGDKSGESVL